MLGDRRVWLAYPEAMVRIIQNVTQANLMFLASIIKGVKIEAGHDEIIRAWKKRLEELGFADDTDFDVVGDLLDQKLEARRRAAPKASKAVADES
jgi:hypothetical protein